MNSTDEINYKYLEFSSKDNRETSSITTTASSNNTINHNNNHNFTHLISFHHN